MALVKCKACNSEVSTAAKSCPKCGDPIQVASGITKFILVIGYTVIFLCIMGFISGLFGKMKF